MKKLYPTFIILLLFFLVGCSRPFDDGSLIDRGGVKYEQDSQKPYSGKVVSLYKNGAKKLKGSYKEGKEDGLWTSWYENGQKSSEGNYEYGEYHGLHTTWYINGQRRFEGNYRHGEYDGLHTVWYEDGQKKWELNYDNGKEEGLVTFWGKNDEKEYKGKFYIRDNAPSSLNGNFFSFDDGQLIHSRFKNGTADGVWTEWYENRQKKFEITFKDGEKVSSKEWNEDGSVRERNDRDD